MLQVEDSRDRLRRALEGRVRRDVDDAVCADPGYGVCPSARGGTVLPCAPASQFPSPADGCSVPRPPGLDEAPEVAPIFETGMSDAF